MRSYTRLLAIILAPALIVCAAFGATVSADGKIFINMLTGSSTGTQFIVGGGLAAVINKYVPEVQVTCQPDGNSINAMRVGKKEAMLGMTMTDNAYYAIRGQREYKEAYPNLQALGGGFKNPMKIITRKDTKIRNIMDLKGKRVALGYPGSVQAVVSVIIMETFGLKADKDYTARWLNPGEACDALRDKTIDAMFLFIGDPASTVLEIETAVDLRFVTYDVDKVIKNHPYWYKGIVPKGTYKCLTGDYKALCAQVFLVTYADADEELIYKITKAIYDHPDEVSKVHPCAAEWVLKNALTGVSPAIPLHPGAARYFKEKGLIKK